MRRTPRMFAGALLAAGIGLSGCALGDDEADLDGTGVPEVFQDDGQVGELEDPDGGEDDPDSVDPGTGGIQEDDETGFDEDAPDTEDDGGNTGPDTGEDGAVG